MNEQVHTTGKIYNESEYMNMLREAFELIAKLPDDKLKEIMEALK